MLRYIRQLKGIIFIKVAAALISIVGIASMPYIMKLLFDYDFSKGPKGVVLLILAYAASIVVGMVFEYISQRHAWKLDAGFCRLIKQDLFEALLSRHYAAFKSCDVSEYLSVFNNDVAVCESYLESMVNIVQWVLQLFVYGFFLFKMDWRLAIVIIICSLVSLAVPKLTGGRLAEKKKQHLTAMSSYTDTLKDLLHGFSLVNNDTRPFISKRHCECLTGTEQKKYAFGKQNTLTNVLTGSSMYALQTLIFGITALLLLLRQITIGTASAAMGYITDFCYPVSYILRDINTLNASRAGKDRIFEVLSQREAPCPVIDRFEKEITFKDVCVSIGDFNLEPFTYTFEKGKKYAIVGPSGVGKSTILKLLMQYISPDSGTISIDGKPVFGKETSPVMICIDQAQHTFHGSFGENATVFGSYPDAKMKSALELFRNDTVNGLLSKENAQDLSGGENQMLHLVRSLSADKDIVMLDESFSAIDQVNAKQLQRELLSLDKTVIMVTHNVWEQNLNEFDGVIDFRKAG